MVDTGVQHSVLTQTTGPLSKRTIWVEGATGAKRYHWTTNRKVQLASGTVTHTFLHVPDCPYPLLGRDLLTKLGAHIYFENKGAKITDSKGAPIQVLTLKLEDEYRLHHDPHSVQTGIDRWLAKYPDAWAETGGMGLAIHRPPLIIELKATATPVAVKQYPMTAEARQGIRPHIKRLLEQGILIPCRSAWNTPLLPVKKPGSGDYRPVQDLREINKRVEDIHPTVPNPYNLLSTLSPSHTWYTVLDLKDAFFCLKLHHQSQPLFAFEWKDSNLGISRQLTWTRLPQGFKNSPTLFDEALHQDLTAFRTLHPHLILLQYVDDILLAAETQEKCLAGTEALLQELGQMGYRASAKKAQLCQKEVTYLGYRLSGGQRWLTSARQETILGIPAPRDHRQVREFLGTAGFCRLWIPGFAEVAAPLYLLTKTDGPFVWEDHHQQAFDHIKRALLEAPALGLPDLTKPFELYMDEKLGYAKGVLTQKLGPWRRPVAYLSKKLDPVAAGWPPCLRMVAALAVLVKDAFKLTLGQPLCVRAPHALESLIRQPPDRWLSNARMTHYQALLLDSDRIQFRPPVALNPATLLPSTEESDSQGNHDCHQVLAEVFGTRPDLSDKPLEKADHTWYTDGSSFLEGGQRRAGAAVTSDSKVIWAEPLPEGTSAQKAELIALTQARRLAEGKKLNVYTDSRYAFATAHIHGEIYKRRGLLTSGGKEIKNKAEILALLEALFLPKELSIMHCPGHQKGNHPEARGNRLADQTAKDIASKSQLHHQSQPLFAFEWKDSDLGISGQLTWTRLPQGFKNSPTLFDEALHQDLTAFRTLHPHLILLQYVDDILLAAETQEKCLAGTEALLQELGRMGYRASAKKAQLCRREVTYLGYRLSGGQRWLTPAHQETILGIPAPRDHRQVREFLGTAGFCRLWIPGFAEMAAPLYLLTKTDEPFIWEDHHQQAFDHIKRALLEAPALGLPDLTKPFELYIDEKLGYAKGVLTQKLGPWRRPVAYLSKKLDPVAAGWPPCLRMVAALAVLVKDAFKLTLGQPLCVRAPHALESLIRQPPDRWLSNARMTHYQALLLDSDRIQFGSPVALNPATLLPSTEEPDSQGDHDCHRVLAEVFGTRPDLSDKPLEKADHTWYTDGSSFLEGGQRRAGAAVTSDSKVIWAEPLPEGTSAQKAELIALTQALRLAEGKKLNVYTDSRYAFATAHIHGEIYKRRGLLTSGGKEIKNKAEILALLEALFLPKELSIMHCPGHQKGNHPEARGNRLADQTAKDIASKTWGRCLGPEASDSEPRTTLERTIHRPPHHTYSS
ncbi:uncharacterized protein LOC103741107 [Nannospalax galili]|uniref:uncharacterized protein LOC103741107 n=1 Tax=Nannospalax galili TaxID=1026970 RepID=UPI00111BFE3B|nr:uncharacterized protein LOC103741107 [Nannospalax galili]